MDNKQNYKRLSRAELIELLIEETERNQQLESSLAEANSKLSSREICVNEAGTLSEAVFKLNGVFDAAVVACAQYEENIRIMAANQAKRNAERESESIIEASRIIEEAKDRAARIEREAIERCEKIVEYACSDVAAFRKKISALHSAQPKTDK